MHRAPMQIKTTLFRCMLPALAVWLGAPQALLWPALSASNSVDGVVFAHNQPGKGVASTGRLLKVSTCMGLGCVGLNEKYCGIVAEYCKTHILFIALNFHI